MNDKSRVIQKRLITGLLSLAFMMSLVLTPASAAWLRRSNVCRSYFAKCRES